MKYKSLLSWNIPIIKRYNLKKNQTAIFLRCKINNFKLTSMQADVQRHESRPMWTVVDTS